MRAIHSAAVCLCLAITPIAEAQEPHGDHDHPSEADREKEHGHAGLHFSHPLVAESVSPDTKIRLDHQYLEFPDDDEEVAGVLEVEYAFHRGVSLEVGIPYSYSASALGNLEAALKFANYAFEEAGLLLGYGVEAGFPTNGDPDDTHGHDQAETAPAPTARPAFAVRDPTGPSFSTGGGGVAGTLGTDEFELAPFLNLGWKRGRWELVSWILFEIPFNQAEQEEVASELGLNFSALFHASPRLQLLLEIDGTGGISGEAVGEDVWNLSPGIKFAPVGEQPLFVGLGASLPLSEDEAFDTRLGASLFWHF